MSLSNRKNEGNNTDTRTSTPQLPHPDSVPIEESQGSIDHNKPKTGNTVGVPPIASLQKRVGVSQKSRHSIELGNTVTSHPLDEPITVISETNHKKLKEEIGKASASKGDEVPQESRYPGKFSNSVKKIPKVESTPPVPLDLKEALENCGQLNIEWMVQFIISLNEQFPNRIKGLKSDLVDILLNDYEPSEEKLKGIALSNEREGAPRAQIHYYNGHFTLSLSVDQNEVFYLDSDIQKKGDITEQTNFYYPMYQIKRAHLMSHTNPYKVILLEVQQQKNDYDCGVFAFAFLVEFFYDQDIERLRTIKFDEWKMRPHLLQCSERKKFTPFPKRN